MAEALPAVARTQLVPADPVDDAVDLAREARLDALARSQHAARCSVCRHAERDEIEALYLAWLDPRKIALAFQVPLGSIQLHAARLGLDAQRADDVETALGRLVERAMRKLVEADAEIGLDGLLSLVDRIQRGRAQRARRVLKSGRVPDPVRADGVTQTWEHMIRMSRTAPDG